MKSWWWTRELCQNEIFTLQENCSTVQKAAYFDVIEIHVSSIASLKHSNSATIPVIINWSSILLLFSLWSVKKVHRHMCENRNCSAKLNVTSVLSDVSSNTPKENINSLNQPTKFWVFFKSTVKEKKKFFLMGTRKWN